MKKLSDCLIFIIKIFNVFLAIQFNKVKVETKQCSIEALTVIVHCIDQSCPGGSFANKKVIIVIWWLSFVYEKVINLKTNFCEWLYIKTNLPIDCESLTQMQRIDSSMTVS